MPFVHMIRRRSDGAFSSGSTGPSFGAKGKMWTTSQSLSGHLALFNNNELKAVYGDCDLVVYELAEKSSQNFGDMIARSERKEAMFKMHNDACFPNLIDNLDKTGKQEDFPWIVYVEPRPEQRYGAHKIAFIAYLSDLIKSFKIKKSTYRVSGSAFAFANKKEAALFRISIENTTHTYDGRTLVEDALKED